MAGHLWTISNSISVLRVVLVIPLGFSLLGDFEGHRWWASGIIVVAVISDFLDGYLARKLHQVSEIGKIIDPLADKISIGGLVIFLVILGNVPLWYAAVVLIRDLLILIGGIHIRTKKKIIAQSNWPGKVAVSFVALYLLLSVTLIDSMETVRLAALWASLVTMAFSLAVYAQRLFIGRAVKQNN